MSRGSAMSPVKRCRLLSEAEWEYAARGRTEPGSYPPYFFGDVASLQKLWDLLDQYVWYNRNSGGKTQPVGQKKPNAFGLYDMHGNVSQWVEDGYHWNYEGAPNDGSVWTEGAYTSSRVIRGGSYMGDYSEYIRAASRGMYPADNRNDDLGFRVARTLTP
jgi:formylglycine-generating enzyme required for sulfatase activity